MSEYFDETIFTDGRSLNYSRINAANQADVYLLQRLNIERGIGCQTAQLQLNNSCPINNLIVNLNPRLPCKGINIYTMNLNNKRSVQLEPFNIITVRDGETNTPIYIGEHVNGNIYTVGDLDAFTSAIMIKYFAINHEIQITVHLQNYISKYFRDHRIWFKQDTTGITQTLNGMLIDEVGRPYNIPNLNVVSDALEL